MTKMIQGHVMLAVVFSLASALASAQSSGSAATALTPEEQKRMDDYKSRTAEILKYNEIVKALNVDLMTSIQAIKDGDSAPDVGNEGRQIR